MIRRVALLLGLAAAATALSGCGSGHVSAASLRPGEYSGTLPNGAPMTLQVSTGRVQVNGRDTYLVDPTSTADFVISPDGAHFAEYACTQTEQGRSLHCDVWAAPPARATPTALPCVSPSTSTPSWCADKSAHVAVDLLRICSNPGC